MRFRNKGVRQQGRSDCGPACLAFIAAHYGIGVTIGQLRIYAGTDSEGTSLSGMVVAARMLGLTSSAVQVSPTTDLEQLPLPAIFAIQSATGRPHYVVVTRMRGQSITTMDPAIGLCKDSPKSALLKTWNGTVQIIGLPTVAPQIPGYGSTIRRFFELARPQRAILFQATIGATMATLLNLSVTVYIRLLVDRVIPDSNFALLNLMTVGLVVAMLFKMGFSIAQHKMTMQVAQQMDRMLMLGYYSHVLKLPQLYLDRMKVGDVTARFGDTAKVRKLLSETALKAVTNTLTIVFSITIITLISWELGLLSLALLPLQAVIVTARALYGQGLTRQTTEATADLQAHVTESLTARTTVRTLGLEGHMCRLTERLIAKLESCLARGLDHASLTINLGELVGRLFTAVFLWVGTRYVLESSLSPGELMSCFALVMFMVPPMSGLASILGSMQQSIIAADRLFEILDLQCERDDGVLTRSPRANCLLEIDRVTFSYPDSPSKFAYPNLKVKPGTLTVLSGPSGSGKSTLLGLMHRIYEPTSGQIRIGDIDISQFTLPVLQRMIAVVPQRVDLFSGTILDNITIGSQRTSDLEQVVDLCRRAGVLDFIQSLPRGFQTVLRERGANLSGGQRQRLAVVRALYRDAPILMCDEPSSALDRDAELRLAKLFREECDRGKVVVIAAHSRGLVEIADQVVDLSESTIVESGTGDSSSEVLARKTSLSEAVYINNNS